MYSYLESRGGKTGTTLFFGLQYLLCDTSPAPSSRWTTSTRPIVSSRRTASPSTGRHGLSWSTGTVAPPHSHPSRGGRDRRPDPQHSPQRRVDRPGSLLDRLVARDRPRPPLEPDHGGDQSFYVKRDILDALTTSADDPLAELPWKLHDFGSRGVSSRESAGVGGWRTWSTFSGRTPSRGCASPTTTTTTRWRASASRRPTTRPPPCGAERASSTRTATSSEAREARTNRRLRLGQLRPLQRGRKLLGRRPTRRRSRLGGDRGHGPRLRQPRRRSSCSASTSWSARSARRGTRKGTRSCPGTSASCRATASTRTRFAISSSPSTTTATRPRTSRSASGAPTSRSSIATRRSSRSSARRRRSAARA